MAVIKRGVGLRQQKIPANQNWMDEFSGEAEFEQTLGDETTGEDNFAELFEASQRNQEIREGEVVDGTVVSIGPEYATIDIGYKCEGLVPIQEFKDAHGTAHVAVGDVVSVYLERMELESGFMLLSKDKAEIIRAWDEITAACERPTRRRHRDRQSRAAVCGTRGRRSCRAARLIPSRLRI